MPEVDPLLNRALLEQNVCFGCGHANPAGLHIEVYRDPENALALAGRFLPSTGMVGFPGIVHGGVIFTALDCLSTWVATVLGPNPEAAWVLRSATAVYHQPASAGESLTLAGWIEQQEGSWDPLTVRTEARLADTSLCVEVAFKVVPLSHERFAEVAGIERLPENWSRFLSRTV